MDQTVGQHFPGGSIPSFDRLGKMHTYCVLFESLLLNITIANTLAIIYVITSGPQPPTKKKKKIDHAFLINVYWP